MIECLTCDLVRQRDEGKAPLWDSIHRTLHWDIVHCNSTSLLGWLILVTRRHISSVDEMTEAEALELGKLIRQVSVALKEEVGCSKTYVAQFAEAAGHQHVHFHIVPRMPDQPDDSKGPKIFRHLGVSPEARVDESRMNDLAMGIRRRLLKE
jgi:diadenosine tetraphosphate (Ap4A) HIT family hydrolase